LLVEPLIRIRALRHTYEFDSGAQIAALDGVDLDIGRGEFVAIVGPNGSGKSTLAQHLNGLLMPTSGEVRVSGMLTTDPHNRWRIRQQVGMVFQNPDSQLVASTVEEDVAFGPENLGVPPAEIRARVDAALDAVGLSGCATRPPHLLSGGQKQLVAIAGVLAMQSMCIVFDEPTSMLDPSGRERVLDTIKMLNVERGTTTILITQSMEEAALASRLLVMHDGRIVADGAPTRIFAEPTRLRSLGLDLPPVVEIAHRLVEWGMPLPGDLRTVDDMARALCTLSF
jgi:energy-coupling factor transport system ATP-binding protein